MILIDTSVLIDRMKTNDPKLQHLFSTLPKATCGIVRAELLSGLRTLQEKNSALTILNAMTHFPIREDDWDFFGDLRSYLGSCSLSVSLPDVAIAGVALVNGIELWSRDKSHQRMSTLIPQLRLFQEPP